jgi:signal transduction histidine kinase
LSALAFTALWVRQRSVLDLWLIVLDVRSEAHDDGNVLVSIADTGSGIGEQDLDRVFNPLFTTKSGGMGMGLSICRSIIEAHDGRIWVAPNRPHGAVEGPAYLVEPRHRSIDDVPPLDLPVLQRDPGTHDTRPDGTVMRSE